jgi:hypothetical protein
MDAELRAAITDGRAQVSPVVRLAFAQDSST